MASGYFPIDPRFDPAAEKLMQALALIQDARWEMYEAMAINCTPEDAAKDGVYLARLDRAMKEIAPCIQGHITHRDLCRKVQGIINAYLPPDSGVDAKDCIADILGVLDGPDWRAAESDCPIAAS